MSITLQDDIIDQFGRSIGMQGLRLRDDGALRLDMQQLGSLAFELVGEHRDDVAVSLTRRVEMTDDSATERILELCHYRAPAPFPVRAGLTQAGHLIFAVRLETSEFTLPGLHQALDLLTRLHDQSASFVRPARLS